MAKSGHLFSENGKDERLDHSCLGQGILKSINEFRWAQRGSVEFFISDDGYDISDFFNSVQKKLVVENALDVGSDSSCR